MTFTNLTAGKGQHTGAIYFWRIRRRGDDVNRLLDIFCFEVTFYVVISSIPSTFFPPAWLPVSSVLS